MITIKTVRDLLGTHFRWDLRIWIYKNDSCAEHPPTVIKRNVLRAEIDNDEIMNAEVEEFDLNTGGLNIFIKA